MAGDDKLKALESALAQIEKQFGKGTVMKLGENNAHMNIETVPTGALSPQNPMQDLLEVRGLRHHL